MKHRVILGYSVRPSTLFPLLAAFLVVGLFTSLFILPLGYTLTNTCPTCQGNGKVHCSTCNGSGKCWICDGTGRIWYMPETDNWCAACKGTGICYDCGGDGLRVCEECLGSGIITFFIHNVLGSTIILSIINISVFVGLLAVSYAVEGFHLGFNEWVYEVEDMGFWFNSSFMMWLLAKHPKRWLKWQSGLNFLPAVFIGAALFGLISMNHVTSESFLLGILFGVLITLLFSILFYRSFASKAAKSATPEPTR